MSSFDDDRLEPPGSGAVPLPGDDAQRALRSATARCRTIAAQIAMLQAELVAATREVVELAGFLGGVTPAAHLAAECQLTGAEARRTVKLAERLERLPGLQSAFDEGRLSEGTVVSLASVATPENESALLDTAANANATQLQRIVRNYRVVKEVLDDSDGRTPDERLSFGVRRDGMWHISGRARPDRGAEIEAAFRAMAEIDADRLVPPSEVHRLAGDSGSALFAGGSLTDSVELDADGRPTRPNDRRPLLAHEEQARNEPIDVRQSDVRPPGAMECLVRLAQSLLAGSVTAAGLLPDRFLTIIHADIDPPGESDPTPPADAAAAASANARWPTLQGGGIVEPDDLAELFCGSWFATVVSEHGRPVTGTSPLRNPPPAMRMALLARDKGCRFCGAAHFLHPHHIRQVIHRGRTTLSNLIMLCGTCHRRLHKQGWRIEGDPNGQRDALQFHRRDGTRIPVESLRRQVEPRQVPPDPGDAVVEDRKSHNDQRLDRFASDVIVDHWLFPPGAA